MTFESNVVGAASTMGEALTECIAMLGGIQRRPAITAYIKKHYAGRWADNTLQGHLYGCCVNNPSGIKNHRGFRRFLYFWGDEDGYSVGQTPVAETANTLRDEIAEQITERMGTEFAYEAHLRDYLAKNLSLIEPGLALWSPNGTPPVEFLLENRRIDILARDVRGTPVVIELKLSRGHDRTVGQAMYYRAKLKQLFSLSTVRIILIASEITEELRLAASETNDILLYEYMLTMKLDKVLI